MDGLEAVAGRIEQIRSGLSSLGRVPVAQPGGPTFQDVLASAQGQPSLASPTGTGSAQGTASLAWQRSALGLPSGAPASLGPGGVPADLAAYGNGRVPAAGLEGLGQGQHRLWSPAARAFRAMEAAAQRDGVSLPVSESYRSYDQQVDMARRKGLYSAGGLAAAPGTSEHGWGRAVDLRLDDRAQQWLRTNAAAYGYAADVPREPWHWAYTPPA